MTERIDHSVVNSEAFQIAFKTYLSQYVTAHKKQKIKEVLAQRTRHFTLVLEDIYKPHNASAVIRTCDCFGIQDLHIIEQMNEYAINPYVTRGAAQWVDLHKYHAPQGSSVDLCFEELRSSGYQIVGTQPGSNSMQIQDLDPNRKTALVFGNEHAGISDEVIEKCDDLIHIPMLGFTESFNISVAAALSLYELTRKIDDRLLKSYFLTQVEREEVEYRWYRDIVKNVEAHEREFLKGFLENQ